MKLKTGDIAPDFELSSTGNKTFHLKENLDGGRLVMYFYPKDFTAGCTREACGFRDESAGLDLAGMRVVGISTDSVESHEKFKAHHSLPFDLLSDPDGKVSRLYGVHNHLFGIANRVTFVLDRDGRILSVTKNMFMPGVHVAAAKSAAGV